MYKYILISILLLLTGCATTSSILAPVTVSVAFINGNPGVTTLGLAKFILDKDGNKIDYKLMNMRWADEKKVIYLEPGVYGVTQYLHKYNAIGPYQTFTVDKEPIIVEFRRL